MFSKNKFSFVSHYTWLPVYSVLSRLQLTELAKRAKSQFSGLSGEPSSYVADNLLVVGQILCGMEADTVAQIPKDELK